ncbi:MAG TPA: creatininase family protein [Rubrobacter sp.]|nr:creatininase family protein [Rubrobacter sp.]
MIDERRVALASMTSPEAAEALAKAGVALLPVGATEQHGPNMSLETDTVVAYRLALRIAAAAYPRAIVAPPLPYGVSYHHMSFPGTMTLSPETFQAVVLEVVESLRQHGVERFFIIDGHAGNQGSLDVLMTKLRFQMGIRAAYLFYFTIVDDLMREGAKTERWGHACEVETSMGLALQPDIVHGEVLEAGKIRSASLPYSNVMESPRVGVPLAFDEITENGALGDARQASEEFGLQLTNAVVVRSVEFLKSFLGE